MIDDTIDSRPSALLTHSTLHVTIDDLMACYELRHQFHNDRKQPLEIVFTFPMPLDAAFLGMEATVAGETRIAQIQQRNQARQRFDDAIADGDSAVLLETLRPGLLCVDLGNLKAGEDGEIVLRFATALSVADGNARFSLPLAHRPRYGRSPLDELATPTHDFAVEHPLDATIHIRGTLANRPVQCSSHAVRFERDGEALRLTLGHAMLDRDLALNFELPATTVATVHLVRDGEGAIGLLELTVPMQDSKPEALDLSLVFDGSGSMSGDAITQSRAALNAIVEALHEDDRVQVLRFGSHVVPLFRRPLRATARVREAMRELADTIAADLGGTEIGKALDRALDGLESGQPGRSRAIILITDGAVQPDALKAAQERAFNCGVRIFVVAVGSSAGVDVLAPLAETTFGRLERAVPAEPIEAAVLRQFHRARQICPLGMKVDWGADWDDGSSQLPTPMLYPGDATTIVAFFPDARARTVRYELETAYRSTALTTGTATLDPARRAWAGQQAYAHATTASEREELALRYGLITQETSAVLVRPRADGEKVEGLPVVTQVSHMLPHGMLASSRAVFALHKHLPTPAPAAYLDAPRFMRKSFAHDDFQKSDLRYQLEAGFLDDKRIAAIRYALRQALEILLLANGSMPFRYTRLLAALDPALHQDVDHWLRLKGWTLDTAHEAARLLLELMDEGVGAALADEDEARISALAWGQEIIE